MDEQEWCRLLGGFDDANIYQTWAYADVLAGKRNAGRLLLRKNGEVVAAAQARIAKLPLLPFGVAYVRWGPLWKRKGRAPEPEVLRQALRALRHEFVLRRGLVLRLLPALLEDEAAGLAPILEEEGFSACGPGTRDRTILMDVTAPLESLREGMKAHWKRELKAAERNGLEVEEGTGDELFGRFIAIYKEMVARKKFAEPNDINQFRAIQAGLPEEMKMKVMLCRSGEDTCAGLVCSAIGNTAVYLFGATSNAGMKKKGSYLLHWRLLARLKEAGTAVYDLNGINPAVNPGTYKFKDDLAGENGRDVYFVGRFDARPGMVSEFGLACADHLRGFYQRLKETLKSAPGRTKPVATR